MYSRTNKSGRVRCLLLLVLTACTVPVCAATSRFASDQYHFTVAPVPDWVAPTPLPHSDRDLRGYPTHYLLSDWQTWLDNDDRKTTEFTRIVYSPRNGTGVRDAAEISIDFHPDYEELILHYVRLRRNGRVVDRLRSDQVRLIQQERDMDRYLYNGDVSALFVLDDVRVGDVIDYAYSIRGRNPVFAGKYFSAYSLGWQMPVDRVAIRIVTAADRHLDSRSYNADPLATERVEDGRRVYSWRLDDAPPLRSEDELPDWYDPFPWLQISEYRNWDDVSRWADALYSGHAELTAPLRRMIRTWRADDNADNETAIRKAVAFVQDEVRYFGVEMGTNSHMPSQPGATFSRRYGDCKDKAVLLSAVLTEMGYPSHPALVSMTNRRAIADWLPSPGDFDHVIVRSEIDGRTYWIDATRTLQRGRLEQRGQPDFGRALVIGDGSHLLATMTTPAGYRPTIDVEELYITDSYAGPADFVVTSRYSHGEAEARRRLFMDEPLDSIQTNYVNYYARIYPGIEVTAPLTYADDQDNNLFTVTEHYRIPDYWEHRDGRLYSDFHGSTIGDYTRLPNTINRKMPLAISYPLHVHHSAILQFPDDVGFANGTIDDTIADAEMRFSVTSSYQNRRLRFDYDYIALSDAVMPKDMRDHLALRRQINDSLTFSAWVADDKALPQQTAYLPSQTVLHPAMAAP